MKNKYAIMAFISFIILVGGIAWAYLEYTEPKVEKIEHLDYAYSYIGSYELSATVTEENPIYALNTILTNMAGYFYNISPNSDIEFIFKFEPSLESASMSIETNTVLVMKGIDREGNPYWTKEIEISSSSAILNGVSEQRDDFIIAAKEVMEMQELIKENLGKAPGDSLGELITTVNVNGMISNVEIIGNSTYTLPIYFLSDYYYADFSEPFEPETKSFYTIYEEEREKELIDYWKQIPIIALGFILFVFCLIKGREGDIADYSEFKEWVSEGVYPGGDWEKEVYIPNLGNLIDVAIDSGKRAIYDKDDKIFFVIDNNILYYFMLEEEEKE